MHGQLLQLQIGLVNRKGKIMKLKCFESTDSNGTENYLIPLGDGSFIAVPKERIEHSIDIVRCKECKYKQHCRKAVEHITYEPTSVTIGYKTVEWCSYGEREGE